MVRRYNRLLVLFYVCGDAALAVWAFILAYGIRFESGLIPVTKGYPPVEQYLQVAPFVAALTPLAFHLQGVYRLRRSRSRVDDFFAVFIGTVLAVVLSVVSTLYVQAYFVSAETRATGTYQVSQLVWALFLGLNVTFAYALREGVRELFERRWRAGIGLKRILIAGAGDLGRQVAERMLQHRELGYQVVGFVDDAGTPDRLGYRGLPVLGGLHELVDVARRERIDHLYVALSLEDQSKLMGLMDLASRECIDVRVVPDLLQFIALRASLEDLDGLPVINPNDMPLQGVHAWSKRALDVAVSVVALALLALPMALIAALVRWTSPGPVFYSQERMGLDGRAFRVYKFRSMWQDAEESSGPVWARDDDPRTTYIGRWLRRLDLDELPQLWNVLKGEMSLVGPRPERPFFVEQFKHRIPQYMLRHKVKAGITGWAQVNGWRGNTSLEKRIEYDLYYIENWSMTLDIKIMWLTLVGGLFRRSAA
jgi:exopolysaccharide biosynthesis polyprenyl glycosylphosphotransferase